MFVALSLVWLTVITTRHQALLLEQSLLDNLSEQDEEEFYEDIDFDLSIRRKLLSAKGT